MASMEKRRAKYEAKARRTADRQAEKAYRQVERARRKDIRDHSANGFTFYSDGTVVGNGKPLARVLDVLYTSTDSRHVKNGIGRAAGGVLTGGMSIAFSGRQTGRLDTTVVIVTDQWVHKVTGGEIVDLTNLYGLAAQAKAVNAGRQWMGLRFRFDCLPGPFY